MHAGPAGCTKDRVGNDATSQRDYILVTGAQLAARVVLGVDVDIPAAGHEIGGLRVGERRGAVERAAEGLDRHGDAGILAGIGRAVEMAAVASPLSPNTCPSTSTPWTRYRSLP